MMQYKIQMCVWQFTQLCVVYVHPQVVESDAYSLERDSLHSIYASLGLQMQTIYTQLFPLSHS